MSPALLFTFVIGYFLILLVVSYYTSRKATNETFFIGNKNSNWMLVAFGMIGTSLSGVTFVSVPGTVGTASFTYFQVVIGYFLGYFIIAYVLLPLYYRLNLTSIYNYLQQRFGNTAYKTGATFFIGSRVLGATARLYLVINVLQVFILDKMGIPFPATTFIILFMILVYTFKGGVKTIVWTDTLQTTGMLVGLVVCVVYIMRTFGYSLGETMHQLELRSFTNIFNYNVNSPAFFLKQIIGGAFITVAMTGLDQEMMQKNISVRNLKDSQKNMITFSVIMVMVNFLFLFLGGLLYLFAEKNGIAIKGDDLFPAVAMYSLPSFISIIFILGLISALFPSADGAITALTSSFCIDILGLKARTDLSEKQQTRTRMLVHLSFAVLFLICVLVFKRINNKSIIDVILKVAGFTYGPLLGLFSFGILTGRRLPQNGLIPMVCLLSIAVSYLLDLYSASWFGGYRIGTELLILNGLLTFTGLLIISKKGRAVHATSA